METILKSEKQEKIISIDRPFIVVGEKINPTGHKKMVTALKEDNYQYILDLAKKQVAGGADVIGVNVGASGVDETTMLPKIAKMVSDVVDVPLCIDSADRKALKAALSVIPGRPLVNSVNGEEASLETVLPVIKEFKVPVVGLLMDDNGIPADADTRIAIAGKILERAEAYGIARQDVVFDPLVLTVGADSRAALVTLETIRRIRDDFGNNMCMGASNVSFGMPQRQLLNQAFLSLAIAFGATSAITDAKHLTAAIRSTDLLLGRDDYGRRYIGYLRDQGAL